MGRLFGTDGVRGVANIDLTADLAFRIGQAGALVLTEAGHKKPRIFVGKDTRISGDMLEAALAAGICSVGAEAVLLGVIPTPAVAYLTRTLGADAGVVISASHNAMEYNGIKFFDRTGFKLPDATEDLIEAHISGETAMPPMPKGAGLGRITRMADAKEQYIRFALSTVEGDFEGLKVALDCANGASSAVSPETLREKKAEVVVIHNEPDGTNINLNCGSTHIEDLKRKVVESGADVGLAFDGDADRVLAVDEKGELVDGDQILAICGQYLKSKGLLKKNAIVGTIMSNLGLKIMGKNNGIDIPCTKVGDRYVLEHMVKHDLSIGGEQSGHIIFLEHNTTGDGLVTGLQLIHIMKETGKKLSELASVMTVLPQVLVNARVANDKKYAYIEDPEIQEEIKRLEDLFEDTGRVLIRPSGTEPLVRVMIEGEDESLLLENAQKLARLIEEKFSE